MKTLKFSHLFLVGAFVLGIMLAWCALVPASVSLDDADAVFGAATCKCGERPDCPENGINCPGQAMTGDCDTAGKYLLCKDKQGNYSCTLDTTEPCGNDGDCELCTGGSYDACPD